MRLRKRPSGGLRQPNRHKRMIISGHPTQPGIRNDLQPGVLDPFPDPPPLPAAGYSSFRRAAAGTGWGGFFLRHQPVLCLPRIKPKRITRQVAIRLKPRRGAVIQPRGSAAKPWVSDGQNIFPSFRAGAGRQFGPPRARPQRGIVVLGEVTQGVIRGAHWPWAVIGLPLQGAEKCNIWRAGCYRPRSVKLFLKGNCLRQLVRSRNRRLDRRQPDHRVGCFHRVHTHCAIGFGINLLHWRRIGKMDLIRKTGDRIGSSAS